MSEALAETQAIPAKSFNISSENARLLQQKGIIAKKAKEIARKEEEAKLRKLADIGLASLVPANVIAPDLFREETLSHVRDEIRNTLAKLKKENDPKARESLSRSLGVLLEHEGHLSGRPKSGVRKPVFEPRRKPSGSPAGSEPEFVG